jgi:acetolactate decarboxylase
MHVKRLCYTVIGICLLSLVSCSSEKAKVPDDTDTLYQVSTISSLLLGNYDGFKTVAELKENGDTGLGTFDALDGEMIMLKGEVYKINSQGEVIKQDDTVTVPFAAVTTFEEDNSEELTNIESLEALQNELDKLITNTDMFYVFCINTSFDYVKTRSVPKQEKPYPILSEVTKTQSVFEYNDVSGTLVIIWCPEYVGGINVSGYHMHFISDDYTKGGHLLDVSFKKGTAVTDITDSFHMVLSQTGAQGSISDIEDEINKVEQ